VAACFGRSHHLELPTARIEEYVASIASDGMATETQTTRRKLLTRLAKICDITNPYEAKETLAKLQWKNSTKAIATNTLTAYYKFLGKQWTPPKYQADSRIPFIPTEKEIDALIANAYTKYATALQTLKETACRTDELFKIQWTDIDTQRRTATITASKHSNSRIVPISSILIEMLSQLPKQTQKVFPMTKHSFRTTYQKLRQRTATKIGNPRILKISPHTLRHWKATMLYHETKDILHVKTILGHKSINSTMIYINIENALFLTETDGWTTIVTHNIDEETKAIHTGFQLVRAINETTAIYKKRK
jgi:integrase